MSAAGQWEVVGKPKKEKAPSRPMTKTQIKQFVENMPRIEDDGKNFFSCSNLIHELDTC